MNYSKVKEDAVGRWPGIFQSLGIEVGDGRHTSCPVCGGKNRFRMDDKNGTGSWYCNAEGAGDGWALIQKVLGIDFKEALKTVADIIGTVQASSIPKETVMTPEKMREIFNGSKLVAEGDPVYRYLTNRGLKKIPDKLRFHPATWDKETKKNQKAMLAIVMSAENKAITMHRTYIDADGNKLNIVDCKKILPCVNGEKITGGACRLFPLDGRKILGVAEGIETAIAATQYFGVPTWAAISANGMESFVPPKGINELMIFGDNDTSFAGHKAAYTLAFKAKVQFKIPSISVNIPDAVGEDWADVVKRRL